MKNEIIESIALDIAFYESSCDTDKANICLDSIKDRLEQLLSEPKAIVGDVYILKSFMRKGKRKPNLTINKPYTIEKVRDSHMSYPRIAIRDDGGTLRWYFYGEEFKRIWEPQPKASGPSAGEWLDKYAIKDGYNSWEDCINCNADLTLDDILLILTQFSQQLNNKT